jgi:hypothetical protein
MSLGDLLISPSFHCSTIPTFPHRSILRKAIIFATNAQKSPLGPKQSQVLWAMITKRDLVQYLNKLSSGIRSEDGEMPPHVWQQFIEYMVFQYKRLNKEARSYADDFFDDVEAAVERKIDSLPEGSKKAALTRKLSMVRGERSPLPILYLDTPVIESKIQYALGQPLSGTPSKSVSMLYETIPALVGDQKLIYAEDSLHREALLMGGPQTQRALEIIKTLSKGMSFKHNQAIEDAQVFRALRGFIQGTDKPYRAFWKDALQAETVTAILKKRPLISFEGILSLPEGADAGGGQKGSREAFSTDLKIRYDESPLKSDQQLQKRSTRHLRDLVRLGMRYRKIFEDGAQQVLDGIWANQKTDMALALWNHYGGKPEGFAGLASFFESEHFRDVPAIRVKQDIWNAHAQIDGEHQRQWTAPADISILSSVLPYTDIIILGHGMTHVVRNRLGLDAKFDTKIYALDEHEQLLAAFAKIAHDV